MTAYPKETIADLVEGRLPWRDLKAMMSAFKDPDRFVKYIQVLQEKLGWEDKVLLPLGPQLYIVQTSDSGRRVRCGTCAHDFGDAAENWKWGAHVFVRDTVEAMQEIYPPGMHADPEWMELREFICPGCQTLLEIDPVPPGYPLVEDFRPDIDTFYRDWLGIEPGSI